MTYKVTVCDDLILQNGIAVASVYRGWGTSVGTSKSLFLIRSRKGSAEAKSFLKHMLKLMTVVELAEKVSKSSPVEAGAAHGWVMPHLKTWVKNGVMTKEALDAMQNRLSADHHKKMSA